MLSFELDEDVSQLQSSVRAFAAKEIRPALRATEQSGPSSELKEKFESMGLLGLDWPEAAGGAALSALYRVIAEEELAFGDLGSAFALDRAGAAAAFLRAIGSEQALAVLMRLSSSSECAALAAAEEGKADREFLTAARNDGSGWAVQGKKSFVLGADRAALAVVLAQVEPGRGLAGAGAFLVPKSAWRVARTHTALGLGGTGLCELVFEDSRIELKSRLDRPGTIPAVLRKTYDTLSLTTAARAVGVARAAYEYALSYAQDRQAFGKPIGHFQAIAFLLADMATIVEAAHWLLSKAAWQASRGDATMEIAEAQAQALETAFFCTNNAVQILGGAGYVQDHPVEKWMRDVKVLSLYGLHHQAAQATVIAADLGTSLTDEALFPLPALHPSIT